MKQTETLIIGASISGLACAATLQRQGVEYTIIEKQAVIAAPWRNHYERLHLHTNKRVSCLPYKKFGSAIPRYPDRLQLINYLEDYQRSFNINPVFNVSATSINYKDGYWITETNNDNIRSRYLVMATGPFAKPRDFQFKGMTSFRGKIIHSAAYKTGRDFKGQKVLVVGFGNSACEIAIDLHEQGAAPSLSVRSAVNVIPRDVLGIPILELSLLMHLLPPRLADTLNAPLLRLLVGDIRTLGLKKLHYGPFEQIQKDGQIPVLDIGIIQLIRDGQVPVYGGIDHIEGKTVYFADNKQSDFDTIVAAIGYYSDCAAFLKADKSRFEDLKVPVSHQQYFGKDGLYFCGFWIGPTGQIREIAADALKIAKDIGRKSKAIGSL